MADNIKIVGEIISIQQVSRYDDADLNLLSPQTVKEDFGQQNDYIEYYVYDIGDNLLNINYSYKNFKLPPSSYIDPVNGSLPIIEIDPIKDLQNLGYNSGEFKVQYNFFNNKISDPNAGLFLKEISADRTELRVGSTVLTNEQIESGSIALMNEASGSSYFVDYLVNFGNNTQVTAVNVALNKVDTGYEIFLKLYQPLPTEIPVKSTLWIVKEKVNPYVFDINLDKLIVPAPLPQLRGPNFDIYIPNQNNVATSYQNYTNLIGSIQNTSLSNYQQLLNLIQSQSIDINIDYADFENFVFFSSADQRLKNFYGKVKEIEDYNNYITFYSSSAATTSSIQTTINQYTSSINTIISQFDGYEYYLYFESSSTAWPKTNNTLPYILASTSSAQSWFDAATGSAIDYDDANQNYLVYSVPSFVRDDQNNNQYITFLKMVGHYFDNIWIFLQSVTDINLANNNLEKGVSKDLVYYVLQSLGTKLYNQYGDSNNVDFLIGNSGSAYYTVIDTQAFTSTGSYLNTIPRKDLLAESYKRIYHNLPLLLKTKGTSYGLETLISTFGILSKDYYTIDSFQSFYSPTGSSITSSILKVKEYGGDVKSGLLDEYNNSKIRIVNTNVTGTVLSPYISILNPLTSSDQFRTTDLHYVDISFSPQDKIDIFTSASIVATVPTWSLDDFIGDPRFQYNSSYPTLEFERNKYLSPLSASLIPYTSSVSTDGIAATDYNSFIRLIQFFDNSLFKMLKDYVPARTSLSTGVTISSPILERNKWVFANPSNTSEIEVNEGTIEGPTIGTEYTDIYHGLTGSRAAYYDGEFTGSGINVYSYFVSGNFNPYLQPTASLTSASINEFNHSDYAVMLNNISSSRLSSIRRSLEPIYVRNSPLRLAGYISSSFAELQDSYETLKTHQLSRYEGVRLSSAKYNDYTDGDISFGKTAVIDRNVIKLGLFSEIVPNRFLPKRNNAVLKYLVDIDGNLTELNLRNTHWEEVQRIFVAGDTASISQFNNQLYSNQKTTDGEKIIFDSGYTYSPILYFSSCSSDSSVAFQNQVNPSAYLATAQNLSSSYLISGSGTLGYPLQGGSVLNLFNSPIDVNQGGTYWTNATPTTPATYSVVETGQYRVYANVAITTTMASGNNLTWSLEMYNGPTKIQEVIQSETFGNTTLSCYEFTVYNVDPSDQDIFVSYTRCSDGFFVQNRRIRSGDNFTLCTRDFVDVTGDGLYNMEITSFLPSCTTYEQPGDTTKTTTLTINNGFSGNTNYSNFTLGDDISFVLRLVNASNANFTASLDTGNNGFVSIGSLAISTGYATTDCPYIANAAGSSITLDTSISSFYGNNYFFTPNPTSGSLIDNSLYETYGDVDYPFNPKPYDILVLYLSDGTIIEYVILNIELINGQLTFTLNAPLSNQAITDLTAGPGNYRRFLLLSRIKDETNAILNFTKRDGKTSYGFLIADNISSNVLDNIDTITREVKQKLLNDQSVINDINGGTFG
jgi:hypothetical protein